VLEAVVRWVQTPSDELRRAALRAAEAAMPTSIAGGLARAAYFAGGSISLSDQPHVAPPADLTARLVGELVLAAAVQCVPQELNSACLRHFLQLAGEVSRGEAPWSASAENCPVQPKELEHA
jgi:hypothetical protein